jgi:hypothetical protein
VAGKGFQPNSIVRFTGSDRQTKFLTSSQLQVTLSGADVAVPDTAELTVFSPGASPVSHFDSCHAHNSDQ